jgi:hypothetical protein
MTTRRNRRIPSVNLDHTPANTGVARGWHPGLGSVLSAYLPLLLGWEDMTGNRRIRRIANDLAMLRGAADRCWVLQTSESKRERMSANMGTREPRPSRVVAQLSWFSDQPKPLPMRQPRGGAPVVVGDVNDVHMAKGCRIICAGEPRCSSHLEASRWAPKTFSGGSQERRIVWKAGCLETCTSGLGLGPG